MTIMIAAVGEDQEGRIGVESVSTERASSNCILRVPNSLFEQEDR